MNSPVFLQFEIGRAKAQLTAFFAVMPGSSATGAEMERGDGIADEQPVALEPKRAKIPDCPDNARRSVASGLLCHKV